MGQLLPCAYSTGSELAGQGVGGVGQAIMRMIAR